MMAAHLNPKTACRFRQFRATAPRFRVLLLAVIVTLAAGCQTPHLDELRGGDEIKVRLDSNSRAHMPGRQIKFFVDLVNQSSIDVDVSDLDIELKASPRGEPDTVSLRHRWRYNWRNATPPLPPLRPEKRMTVPLVPEKGVEFPLEILRAGDYDIVAVVNGRFASPPYSLAVVRPDIRAYGLDSTMPGPHRTFDGEKRRFDVPDVGSERLRDRPSTRSGREGGEKS